MKARDFADGFLAVFRGILLIFTSKRLLLLSLLPILIGLGVFLLGGWFILSKYVFISSLWDRFFAVSDLNQSVGQFLSGLFYLGRFFATALALFAMLLSWVYMSFLITKLFAGPFYSLIALRVLKDRGVSRSEPIHFLQFLFLSFRTTAVNLLEIVLFLLLGTLLFVFSFVPFLNVLAGFGFFLVMAFDSADYSFDIFNFGLAQRLKYFFSHFLQFCGFALAISLVIMVPGLNLILFAASVAGAADLASRSSQNGIENSPENAPETREK